MITGFETALSEITLVLFTTLAPSGVVAFILMGLPVLRANLETSKRQKLNTYMGIPLAVSMVGLIASATHLGNPANALYVFLGVGRSPLSTEVFCAVVFLTLAGLYWLYTFAEHQRPRLQRVWLVFAMGSGVAFVVAMAFAYTAQTIVSWYTVYVPLNVVLNALVGGPVLAIACLRAAGYECIEGRMGQLFVVVAAIALAVNLISFSLQSADLFAIENSFATAADLVPSYGILIIVFGVLCLVGLGINAAALWGLPRLSLVRSCVAAALVFVGIFIMRFAFYMMHMTVGLGM